MPWFKVDDGFYSHPKVLTIPRRARAAALGTWIICGTWSADKLTDGLIPDHMIDELGATAGGAQSLVDVGLWKKRRNGFAFVNWGEFQPTRNEVEESRKTERERKSAYRAAKAINTGGRPAHVPVGQIRIPDTPTRPDPTRPEVTHLPEIRAGIPTGPFCARHPGGTDKPCGPCRTARIAFEAEAKKPKPAPRTSMVKRSEPHDHRPDKYGYCPRCGEK